MGAACCVNRPLNAGLAVQIFPVTTRTFTMDMALSEQGRGAAWHGRETAWARHAMCESAFKQPHSLYRANLSHKCILRSGTVNVQSERQTPPISWQHITHDTKRKADLHPSVSMQTDAYLRQTGNPALIKYLR